jgi:DegV family protein with EDD domain
MKSHITNKPVEVIDTQATAMALGFIVLAAARAAAEGRAFDEVVKVARATQPTVGLIFTVETLEYLRRGGRIGGAQAFLGGLLDMKPILELRNGRVEPVERVRTKKKALDRVLDLIAGRVTGQKTLRFATLHAATPVEAKNLLDAAKNRFGAVETILSDVSPTVAVHTGPGTVGLAYCIG